MGWLCRICGYAAGHSVVVVVVVVVPDADFWDAMDFYKSALKPLKKKFAMQLITLTFLTGIPTAYLGRGHTAGWIPFSTGSRLGAAEQRSSVVTRRMHRCLA